MGRCPLLPTTVTDGKGVATGFTYDANGRQLSKLETVQTTPSLVRRQTTWTYNPTFPGLVASVTGPFSPPAPATLPVTGVTTYAYNAHGALVQQTDAREVVMIRQLDPADRPTQGKRPVNRPPPFTEGG